jgi:amino acid adenylation domain-containing protein
VTSEPNTIVPDGCLHTLVEEQVIRNPDAIAVEYRHQSLSYGELNARANQLAHHLKSRGIGPESKVAVCLRRSLELPVALLGVLKAGAACLPLDPAYPKDRLAYLIDDSKTPLILTQAGLLTEVTDFDADILHLDTGWSLVSAESTENVSSGASPENLAFVIYTSGSTGKPRGVMLTHRGLTNHTLAAARLFGLTRSDRMAQFASISFDIAIEEIFPTWTTGGRLILREENASLAAGDFLIWVEQNGVTALDLPTAYWHELARELSDSDLRLPASLRIVVVGGEKASASALAKWRRLSGSRVRWINTYGPTETSVIVSWFEPDLLQKIPSVVPIGRPIPNMKIYILGQSLQPLPMGVTGEVYISGPGLARGYLNREELTAEKFVRNPFGGPDSRMYKTGDFARFLSDGTIAFVGRADDQLKIRGYRVELGEIEMTLESHPGVHEVVVLPTEDARGDRTLVAYVVRARKAAPTRSDLRLYVQQKLPHYMVPSAFVLLESLPTTPNGKVDKRAFSPPQAEDFFTTVTYVPPRTEVEASLAQIWEDVLDKKPVGIQDNFFDLGGHSLLAARLMQRLEQEFGKRIPLTALLAAPTIQQLAGLLRQEEIEGSWSSLVPIQAQGSKPPFFCVHGVGGNVVGFRDLARHLGEDQPFYALQPQGLDGRCECLTNIPEMAQRYLEEIRKVQPEGPYRIGGYSFGGLVAYEMAQMLAARGEEVSLLALFDTYPGRMAPRRAGLKSLLSLPLREQLSFAWKKGSFVLGTLGKRLELQFLPRALRNVRQACARAAAEYRIQPYRSRITLFRVREKSVDTLHDPYAIWWDLAAGGIDLREIDGDHLSLLKEPQVGLLARELSDCLRDAMIEPLLAQASA